MVVGLVLVTFKKDRVKEYLFRTPKLECISVGDLVTVEGSDDQAVVKSCVRYIDDDSDEYEMIVRAAGASLPLKKVLSRYIETKFEYDEEDE